MQRQKKYHITCTKFVSFKLKVFLGSYSNNFLAIIPFFSIFTPTNLSNGNQQNDKNEGTQIRRRQPLMLRNKSKYKQEGFDGHSQPDFGTHTSSIQYFTKYNSASVAVAAHCSHLSESRDCSINSCFSWKVEKKEECFLPSKEQKCGKGTRKLLYTCVDHNGVSFTSYIYVKTYHNLDYLKIKRMCSLLILWIMQE